MNSICHISSSHYRNDTRIFLKEAVSLIRKNHKGENIFIEASGGITLNNIIPYLKTGINAISIGALTHHAVSKDIKLDFIS